MNIFDPLISGSLSVSGSGEISGDLTVLGTINATISGTTSDAISASHAANYTLTSSFGTFTSSYTTGSFTGSFIGDGSGLTNIPASGVTGLNLTQIADGNVTASVSNVNGLRVNSNTEITGSLTVDGDIIGNADFVTLRNKPTLVSGSSQINITGTTDYSTFSSSISLSLTSLSSSIATTDLNQTDRLISLEGVSGSYATTGSNIFIGTQTHSGSIIPSVDNEYDLGSVTHQWRDVYISSGSLYIDGTKVLSSTAQELIITTDEGQSIKILEGTTDSIVLQTADGNIELKSSADGDILLDPTNGKITLKGTVEVLSGNKIQSSVGGTPVVFANDIVVSGSIDLTGTIDGIDLQSLSSSLNTRIGGIEISTGSLNSFTSSASGRLNSIETVTSSFVTYSGTTNSRLTSIESSTSSLNSFTSSADDRLNSIEIFTGSLNNYTGSNNTIIGTLQTATGALNSYTGSNTFNINAIHTATSSLNSFTSSINTTIKNRLNTEGVISGSSQVILTGTTGYSTFSSSVATSVNDLSSSMNSLSSSFSLTDTSHNTRLTTIESRYATTGSNTFIGDQTITGSLYISQNLIVQGSSSLENITASAVSIGTNTIVLNTDSPAFRYAGISVFDSGSTNVTASLFYDSLTNQWKFKHSDVGTNDASILLFGPLGSDIDNTPLLESNYLTKVEDNEHGHHLTTSSIFDNGSKISLKNNTEITGSLIITSTIVSQGTTLVSGSGQISYAGITNVPSGIVSGAVQVKSLLPTGTVSGSSQVLIGSGVWSGSAQLPSGIVSGSSQVSFNGITDKPTLVSGSSQVSFNGITDKPTLVSGSSQITFSGLSGIPSGIVSGSSQVLAGTTIHSGSFFNNITVVSGSAQISFNGITDKPTLVSGSSQISYPSLSNIPGGLVSGSSQIDLTLTTNYSSGIKTRLNAENVISGSAQVVAALPSGTVSGSSQIILSGTTGYGSVINQSVLTTSTPTFAELTINSNQDGKLTLRVPSSGDSNDWNYINFVGANGTRDMYFGTDSSGTPTWTRDDTGLNIGLGSVATVNGVQIVTNSGTWGINITGNAATATSATDSTKLPLAGGTLTGDLRFNNAGYGRIAFTDNYHGFILRGNPNNATGDITAGDVTSLVQHSGDFRFYRTNGSINEIYFQVNATAPYWRGNVIYHAGNFTNNSSNWDTAFGWGNHASAGYASASLSNNKTYTSTGNAAGSFLGGHYSSGGTEKPNSGTFGAGKFKVAMLSGGNLGFGGSWNDVMWVSSYNGGDVKSSHALVFDKYSTNVWVSDQNFDSGSWGTGHLLLHSSNFTSYAMAGAGYSANQNLNTNSTVQFGSIGVGVSPAVIAHFRGSGEMVRFENTSTASNGYTQLNFKAGSSNGYIWLGNQNTTSWAGAGGLNIYTENGNIDLWSNAVQRVRLQTDGHLVPFVNGTYNLGSASLRWNTVFTSDLSLSNGIGDYTIVEGENDLFLYNNKQNKVYKFMLQEVNAEDATPKRPE
jgi:hypothetical protein